MLISAISWNRFALPWLLSGVAAIFAILYLIKNWHRAQNQWAVLFTFLTLAEWSIFYGVYLRATNIPAQEFWIKIYFIGIAFFPTVFLNYTLSYTRISKQFWRTTLRVVPLLISLVFAIAVATNDQHHLAWSPPPAHATNLELTGLNYGILLWAFVAYALLIIIIELTILAFSFFGKVSLHRWQAIIIIILILLTAVGVASNPSLIPLGGGFLSLILVWLMPKIREQSFLPYSYKIATKTTANALIIIDTRHHILDINQTAENLFGCKKQNILGADIRQIPQLDTLAWEILLSDSTSQSQITLTKDGSPQQFKFQVLALNNWLGHPSGYIISIHNITQSETLADALQSKSDELERNYNLQNALAEIVAQMGYSTSPTQVLEIMATQFQKLGLEFILGILDDAQENLSIEFVSLNTKKLRQAEKLAGVTTIGYKLSASQWPFDELFRTKDTILYSNTFDLVRKRLPQIPEVILKRIYKIVEIPITAPLVYLPLITEEKNIGAFSIWGYRLENASKDILRLFANQIAITLDNARRYEAEKAINEKLSRSKAFTTALNTVATTLSETMDLDIFVNSLNEALSKLDTNAFLILVDEDEQTATLQYGSDTPPIVSAVKKYVGINLQGYRIDRRYWGDTATDLLAGKILYIDNAIEWASTFIPKLVPKLFKEALLSINENPNDKIIVLPLLTPERTFGALCVVGKYIREEDIPTLSIFASQISSTLQNAHLYQAEQERSAELARSKTFVTALNTVATTLSETMDLDIFINSLSETLLELGFGTFLVLLDDDEQSVTLQYGSHLHPLVKSVQKMIGINLQGYRVDRRYWDDTATDLFAGKTLYIDRPLGWASSFIPKLSPKLLEKALLAIKQNPEDKIIFLPILRSERALGALAIWGKRIREEDIPTLSIFANQIGSTLQNAHLYQAEQERSAELARSKAFTAALSTVAAEIGQTRDLDRVSQVLGDELKKLGLGNLLVRLSADGEIATIDSISTTTEALDSIKKFTGVDLKGYRIKRKYWARFAEDYFYKGKALFITNPVEFTSIVMPKIPFGMLEKALKVSVGHTKDKAVYLPLIEGKEVYGILGIWGVDLREEDIPALSIFASQVSATMQSAEEIESEREETNKVTRANRFIRTLSQVALKLEGTSDPDNILDILSADLSELEISFMLTTISENNTLLTLRYISIPEKWRNVVEKLIGREAANFTFHKEALSFWYEILEEKKSIITDDSFDAAIKGISSASKIPIKTLEPGLRRLFNRAGWNTIAIWHPLISGNKVIGTINFWGAELREEDLPALTIFANQIANAFENARLYSAEKQRSQDLATSLEEKNVLLKEVHHRVKNNLQVISSLLNLQAAKISDTEILDMFSESRDRIRSMALVHEKLYQSSDLAQVDFGEYLRGLSNQLMQSYSSQSRRIKMNVEIENISLGIDQAVPCGLIVNEIVTNSIKHAFPDYQEGKITIQLHSTPNNQVKLLVKDNGIGIPSSLSLENPSTLGMQIISLLTEQIGGEVSILRKSGTGFEITF